MSHAGARVSLGGGADGGGADGGGAANDGWCFGHVFCHLALFALGSDRVLSTFFFVCSVVLLFVFSRPESVFQIERVHFSCRHHASGTGSE